MLSLMKLADEEDSITNFTLECVKVGKMATFVAREAENNFSITV